MNQDGQDEEDDQDAGGFHGNSLLQKIRADTQVRPYKTMLWPDRDEQVKFSRQGGGVTPGRIRLGLDK